MNATPLEFWSLIAAIVSVILALVAIGVSFGFFWLSFKSSRAIGETTGRLEEVVGLLHRDTFSTLRDTYSEVLKHSWTGAERSQDDLSKEIDKRADEKFVTLRDEVNEQLEPLLKQQQRTEADARELRALVDRSLEKSRRIDEQAREETLQRRMDDALRGRFSRKDEVSAQALYDIVSPDGTLDNERFCEELHALREKGAVQFKVNPEDASQRWVPPMTALRPPV